MKFDLIIANPPYQMPGQQVKRHKLWPEFVYKALNEWSNPTSIISMIHPALWFKSPSSKKNKKLGQTIAQHWLKYINLNTSKDHFPTIGDDICHYIIYKGKSCKTEVVWDKTQHIKYTGGWKVLNPSDEHKISILDKMIGDKNTKLASVTSNDYKEINGNWKTYCQQGIMSEQPTDEYNTEVYYNMSKTVWGKPKQTGWRCYINNSGYMWHPTKPDKYIWVVKDKTCFGGTMCIPTNTEQEAKNIQQYLRTKPYRYFMKIRKGNGASFNQALMQAKALDKTRSWTDQDVYKYFKFTQDEIDLIEDTLKDNKAV
jgi:hypothetical protein